MTKKLLIGKCVLERMEGDDDDSSIPLLKDMYASERRKAKVLNFSLAYGKTSHGLSKDWGVSKEEADETLSKCVAIPFQCHPNHSIFSKSRVPQELLRLFVRLHKLYLVKFAPECHYGT